MSDLKILHLSDLHWSAAEANDIQIVIEALCADIRKLREDGLNPDILVFTGDLVLAGEKLETFEMAYDNFLVPVLEAANLSKDRLFLVPGNHDISREFVRQDDVIEAGLKQKLTTVESVNSYIDKLPTSGSAKLALGKLDNFNNFISKLGLSAPTTSYPLLQTNIIEVNGLSVGIAQFNTAWRASGEPNNADRHMLILGERNIDHAIKDLESADIKIAMLHHPLDWLVDFDSNAVASRLYHGFDILMCGHTHKSFPESRMTPFGSSLISQTGCLYHSREYFNGYQILKVDPSAGIAEFFVRTYVDTPRRAFDKAVDLIPSDGRILIDFKTKRSSPAFLKVESILRVARPHIRTLAAEHINIAGVAPEIRLDLKEAFICPPLSLKGNKYSTGLQDKNPDGQDQNIEIEALLSLDRNLLVIGAREAGKTSLAHYIAVLTAEGVSDQPRIPVVLDYRNFKPSLYGIKRAISIYLTHSIHGHDVEGVLNSGNFLFLIDNFSGSKPKEKTDFENLIKTYPACRWICFSDSRHSGVANAKDSDLVEEFRSVHIQQLPRKSIRKISTKWCKQIGSNSETTFNAVMNQLRYDNLPRTGYIVTLLLWAVYQEKKFEKINESILLTNMIDFLLGKADFQQALQNKFDPVSKEITLQSLARYLHQNQGIASINDTTVFLISFFKEKALPYNASDVINTFIQCGILTRSEDSIMFKYRCFQDYFVALLLRDETTFFDESVKGQNFLKYTRELDLMSGLVRRNGPLLSILSKAITEAIPVDFEKQSKEKFDTFVSTESAVSVDRKKLKEIKKKKLSSDQIDDLLDSADKQIAKAEKSNEAKADVPKVNSGTTEAVGKTEPNDLSKIPERMATGMYIAALELLGKVIRNSEFADAKEKEAASRLFVRNYTRTILVISEKFEETLNQFEKSQDSGPILQNDEKALIVYLVNKAIFLGIETAMNTVFGTEKMFATYEVLLTDDSLSNMERTLITMLLLDLRHPKSVMHFNTIIEANKKQHFILSILTDKLWNLIHSKVTTDQEREIITAIVVKIEESLGASKAHTTRIIENIKKTAIQTNNRESADSEKVH